VRTASSALIDGHWGPEGRKWVNIPLSMTFPFYLDITRLREEGKRDDTALAGKRLCTRCILPGHCLGASPPFQAAYPSPRRSIRIDYPRTKGW
jgi:hypothetical protein